MVCAVPVLLHTAVCAALPNLVLVRWEFVFTTYYEWTVAERNSLCFNISLILMVSEMASKL